MPELLTGAQILCRVLLEQGVDTVFGYPGGAIMPWYHALPEFPGLRHVLVRHEQAAAHAADGYARASGRPGVCVATSGPGATNLVTGLATASMDSSPVVAITGQVPARHAGPRRLPGNRHHRHHPADHQAQRAGPGHQRAGRPGARGLCHRHRGAAGAGADRCAEGCAESEDGVGPRTRWQGAGAGGQGGRGPRRSEAGSSSARGAARGGAADRRGEAAADDGGARRHPLRRLRRGPGPRRAHRHAGHHHAARHQRLLGGAPAAPRHAGDARRGPRQPRHPAGRPDPRHRTPVRRPGHRQHRRLRAPREDHPRRARSLRDREERAGGGGAAG